MLWHDSWKAGISKFRRDEHAKQQQKVKDIYKKQLFLMPERILHKDYDHMGSVGKITGLEPREAWRQDVVIGGKQPVVK